MAKLRTNFLEIVMKELLVGKYIYTDNGAKIRIDDINYQPILQEVYIKSGDDGYKLSVNSNYDFELDILNTPRIVPNKGKITGEIK